MGCALLSGSTLVVRSADSLLGVDGLLEVLEREKVIPFVELRVVLAGGEQVVLTGGVLF